MRYVQELFLVSNCYATVMTLSAHLIGLRFDRINPLFAVCNSAESIQKVARIPLFVFQEDQNFELGRIGLVGKLQGKLFGGFLKWQTSGSRGR